MEKTVLELIEEYVDKTGPADMTPQERQKRIAAKAVELLRV